mgnify:CR=1 FL=1
MNFHIINKYYSKEDNLFHIIKEKKYTFEREEKTYALFDKFYKALDKDLVNADLLDYDFYGVDLSKYDLTKARISSGIMIKLGVYNNTLFESITKDSYLASITPSASLELVPSRCFNFELFEENNVVLCYISDLHLNHKIINKFKNSVNKFELDSYFKKVVEKLKNSLPTYAYNYSIVFVGDVSYNFDIFKLFFKFYRKEIPYKKTFVVLGNHELWDTKLNKNCKSIEEIIESYRKFLNSFECKIYLLENQLFLPNDKQQIYSQEDILTLDKNILRQKFLCNGYAIFGGIGYAGMNEEFNANQGIYRTQYITREQEKERSNLVESLHKRLTEIASDKKLFFITHMPKEDWSKSDYNKNWFYISGHTHKNKYIDNEELKVYADNQVGYLGDSYSFKYLMTTKEYNIFQDYADGIYEITRDQYKRFYWGIGSRIDFNRNFDKLFMLKRNGIYCFLIKPSNSNDLKLLNGGSIKNVGKHDINYFYENLVNYSNSVKLFLESYENYQKQISNEIKKIGGSGYIHGSIIDIDFYNHLYINPLDATITPYFAYSMIDKYVYTNLISLLKAHNKELYENYIKLLGYGSNNKNLIIFNNNLIESNKKTFVSETDMYRISRILKGFQYTTKNNIVRLWNDTIATDSTKESGRLIVSGLINPEEMKHIKAEQRKTERQQRKVDYEKEKKLKPCLTDEEKNKILFEKYSNKLFNLNKNIKVISYNGAREKAEYECLICGYKWFYRPDHFSNRYKYKCPKCKN